MTPGLRDYLDPLPFCAVLRGISPAEIDAIGDVLADAGFRILEVPLNSPQPFASIERLAARFGARCLVGAGTVIDPADVARVADAGGRVVVMPHADTRVIAAAKSRGLTCMPGVATPTEAFAALAAGADALKLFPAEQSSPAVLKAWRAVLPRHVPVLPVGGIAPDNMAPWLAAGAAGFGIGSSLYASGRPAVDVAARARDFADAWRHLHPASQGNRA